MDHLGPNEVLAMDQGRVARSALARVRTKREKDA
jgi:hypothetical protein